MNDRSGLAVVVAALTLYATLFVPAVAAQPATGKLGLILNEDGNSIVLFDPTSNRVVGTFAAGAPLSRPHSAAYDPVGRRLIVGNLGANLTVFDLTDALAPKLVADVRPGGGGEIHDIVVAGGLIWLAHLGDSTVYAYDPGDFSAPRVALGRDRGFDVVHGLAVRPGTDEVWVSNRPDQAPGFVLRIDARTRSVLGQPLRTTGSSNDRPLTIGFTADGRRAYVANGGMTSTQVTVIDVPRFAVETQIDQDAQRGRVPFSMIFDPASGRMFVINREGGTVSAIDVATNTVAGYVPVGPDPRYAQLGPDGRIYATVNKANKVVVFDPRTLAVVAEIVDPAIVGPGVVIFVDTAVPSLPKTGAGGRASRPGDSGAWALLIAVTATLALYRALARLRRVTSDA